MDLLVTGDAEPDSEAALREIAPGIGSIHYIRPLKQRSSRIVNLLTGMCAGRAVSESPEAVTHLNEAADSYDAIYIAPLMSYIDPTRHPRTMLNAVDSFAKFNDNAYRNRGGWRDLLKRELYAAYERKILRRVSLTSFVSKSDTEYVKKRGGTANIVTIPNGVDTDYFYPNTVARDPETVLFTGNFSYAPNSEAALYFARHVFPQLRKSRPGARFMVVGRDAPDELRDMPGVTVTGFVDDIRQYYQRCSVFVCPLLSGAGMKNKVLEAMASGIPIVSNRLGADGIPVIQPDVHYLGAETVEDFVEAVLGLWSNPERSARFATSARDVAVQELGWNRTAEKYYTALASVASKRAGSQE